MKTNKKAMRIMLAGILLDFSAILLHHFVHVPQFIQGILIGFSIVLMTYGLSKITEKENGREKVENFK